LSRPEIETLSHTRWDGKYRVYLDRTEVGLKPRFVKGEPPTDADVTAVVQDIRRRIIRTLRRLGYLEAGIDTAVATGYDPLVDDAPELARTMAASVQQRIAFGERAGQQVRRIGAGFGAEGETPTLTRPRCASVQGFSLHANTQVPAHRRDQLERLICYTARGAVSLERLTQDTNGDLDNIIDEPPCSGPERPPQRTHHTGSYCALKAIRIANSNDQLSHPYGLRITELRGEQMWGTNPRLVRSRRVLRHALSILRGTLRLDRDQEHACFLAYTLL
jgi:hypothetical protein